MELSTPIRAGGVAFDRADPGGAAAGSNPSSFTNAAIRPVTRHGAVWKKG